MRKILLIGIMMFSPVWANSGKFDFLFGASYSYLFDYQYLYFTNQYEANHIVSVCVFYPFVKNTIHVGLELGADIPSLFSKKSHSDIHSGLVIHYADTSIVKYVGHYQRQFYNPQFRILIPMDIYYKSFFVELSPEIDLNFLSYNSQDSTIWYQKIGGRFIQYATTTNNDKGFYNNNYTSINYSIGYQWDRFQIKFSGNGFNMAGLSVRYFFIAP